MTSVREDLPPIQFGALADALLQSIDRLVPSWLPAGEQHGHEYKCGSLAGGKGDSCSVNMTNGKWSDFATGESGRDLLDLYAQIHGLSKGKAAVAVAREEGLESVAGVVKGTPGSTVAPVSNPRPAPAPAPAPKPRAEAEGWATVRPVPEFAQQPTFQHYHRAPSDLMHTAEYRLGGDVHGYVVRFATSDGGKDTLPYTFNRSARDGSCKWHWRQWDEPRPLYFPGHALPGSRTVVLVEGEVKGEVLQTLLDAAAPDIYCVASWPGGCKAWKKADWSWLAGCSVLLWPDCDSKHEPLTPAERKQIAGDDEARKALEAAKPLLPPHKQPGMAAMLGIGAVLRDEHTSTVSLLPIPQPGVVLDGWDARDAIETDGWDSAHVLAFFGQAQPLPAVDAAPEVEKKNHPVGTKSADKREPAVPRLEDDCSDDLVKVAGRLVPDWMAWYYDTKNMRWNVSRKLVINCLEKLPELRDVLGFDELRNSVQCRQAWPWQYAKPGEIRNADALLLGKHLTDVYGLPSISKAALEEAMQTVANTRPFHPIRDLLIGLKWDGKARLDRWLIHVLGEKPDTLRPALAEYLGLVGRFWILGMVYRVMEPGCKFDYCPVLEGSGGLRKSTLVEVLCGSQYFSDTPFEVGRGKEAQEQVQGLWLYEIAELTHFSKSEVGAIKAFISAKVDRYRVAYGTVVESFPRQCVLVGTTNEDTYLRDRTGNRRFWPVPVRQQINTEWVAKYREQLLAEAFALYQQGAVYTPTSEEEDRLFKPMQESRLVETAVESELLHVLTREPGSGVLAQSVNNLTEFVTMAQLSLALGVDAAKSTAGLQSQISGWLKHEGWDRVKKQQNGVRAWGFLRPKGWPAQDRPGGLDEEDQGRVSAAPAPEDSGGAVTFSAPAIPPTPAAGQGAPWTVEADDEPF